VEIETPVLGSYCLKGLCRMRDILRRNSGLATVAGRYILLVWQSKHLGVVRRKRVAGGKENLFWDLKSL
jgi:hypothetical protein